MVLLCALVLAALVNARQSRAAATATEAGWSRLVRTQELRNLMSQAADDATAFFATGEARFAERCRERIAGLRQLLATLRAEARGDESRKLHSRTSERVEAWVAEYIEPTLAWREAGTAVPALAEPDGVGLQDRVAVPAARAPLGRPEDTSR
jgi:CHASE3 domain sensor protein